MSLKLKKLIIRENCKYRKKLNPGTYEFLDDDSIDAFYGKNIEISVIVGKNGSGKSSLLEIIFRMMNNLSAYIAHGVNIESSTNIVFVGGIDADLYYSIDKNNYILKSRNKSLALVCGENNWIFGNRLNEFSGYTDGNRMSYNQKKKMCKNLFFALISNYSVQSYIEADYASEETYRILDDGTLSEQTTGKVWLHSVFHKNDGYLTAININPFRDKGIIDMLREEKLERQRMQALLLHFYNQDKDFIKGYKLSRIEYKFNWKSLYNKLRGNLTKKSKEAIWDIIVGKHEDALSFDEVNWEKVYNIFKRNDDSSLTEEEVKGEWNDILNKFDDILARKSSIAKSILKGLGVWRENINNRWLLYAYLYIVNKALSIANTYPSYSQYSDLIRPEAIDSYKIEDSDDFFNDLAVDLLSDYSHITNKIWQAINFIKKIDSGFECDESTSFTMADYRSIKIEDGPNCSLALENEIRCLPPSFFEYKIYLRKEDSEEEFPIENMSAGERQLYYIVSTLIYHILNIKSVTNNRINYRNLAIVLDEVELGFHPEYQVKFIHFIIDMFKRLGLSRYLNFHFLITTHSPFLLSDFRKSNILYLEQGKIVDKDSFLNPFCANINDILSQSFFLRDGFIGYFARKKVMELLNWLSKCTKENKVWTVDKAKVVADSIGEPIVKERLKNMINNKINVYAQDINK